MMTNPVNGNTQKVVATTTATTATTGTTGTTTTTTPTQSTSTYNPANNSIMDMNSMFGVGYGSATYQGGMPNMATGASNPDPYVNLDLGNSIYSPASGGKIAGFSMGSAAMLGGMFGGFAMAGMEAPSYMFADNFVAQCIGLFLGKGDGTDSGISAPASVNISAKSEDENKTKGSTDGTEKEKDKVSTGTNSKDDPSNVKKEDGTKVDDGTNETKKEDPASKMTLLKTLEGGELETKDANGNTLTDSSGKALIADGVRNFTNKDNSKTNSIVDGKLTVDGNKSSNINTFMAFGLTNNTKATMKLNKEDVNGMTEDFFKYEKDAKLGNADDSYDETEFIKAFESYTQNVKTYELPSHDERKGRGIEMSEYDTSYLKTLFKSMAGKDGKLEKSEFESFISGFMNKMSATATRVDLDNYGNEQLKKQEEKEK